MSSMIRNIQRAAVRAVRANHPVTPYKGRGSKLGVSNPDAGDKLASDARRGKQAAEKVQDVGGAA